MDPKVETLGSILSDYEVSSTDTLGFIRLFLLKNDNFRLKNVI